MNEISKLKTRWIVRLAMSMVFAFGAGQVHAMCSQSNLTGTWYFNGMSGNVFFGELWETDFCKIKLNSSGKVLNSGSQCLFRDWTGRGKVNVKSGQIQVNASCKVTGRIRVCDGELCASWVADDARMDLGKTMMTFIARRSDDVDIVGFFTAVKQ